VRRIGGFLDAIRNTVQNWHDTTQSKLPSYRRRIVHVYTAPWEGGYNFNMSPEEIRRLGDRGQRAGSKLAALDADWWDEHRWTRYRSAMALLEAFLAQMSLGYRDGVSPQPLSALIARPLDASPKAYPWRSPEQAAFDIQATADLMALIESWAAQPESFGENAPRPLPVLRIGPRV
jgi:hypothetical protein